MAATWFNNLKLSADFCFFDLAAHFAPASPPPGGGRTTGFSRPLYFAPGW